MDCERAAGPANHGETGLLGDGRVALKRSAACSESVRSWLDFNTFGLRALYEQAKDIETTDRAVEAFLEVCRLSGELKIGEEGRLWV